MQPGNIDQLVQVLLNICVKHRHKFGIKGEPYPNDCELKACRTGCPVKRMPDALTNEDFMDVEKEVAFEELKKMKQAKVEKLAGETNEA